MPDATRSTISATEASALLNASRYATRWMLWQKFANNLPIDQPADNRMDWGKRLEPLVLQAAAEDLKLEVISNRGADGKQSYGRRGLLGCSRDALIICPDRGPGALETKCVFDYRSWMENWSGGEQPPREYEIQLQTQCYVGGPDGPFSWGVIAAWVCGEMFYFERKPMRQLWDTLEIEAARFFDDVRAGREPEPFGSAVELPLLVELFPPVEKKVKDCTTDEALLDLMQMFTYHRDNRLSHMKGEESAKAKLRAVLKDNETLLLPHGAKLTQSKSGRLKAYIPADAPNTRVDL